MGKNTRDDMLKEYKKQLESRKYCVEHKVAPNYKPVRFELREIFNAFHDMVSGMWRFDVIDEDDFDYLHDKSYEIYLDVLGEEV